MYACLWSGGLSGGEWYIKLLCDPCTKSTASYLQVPHNSTIVYSTISPSHCPFESFIRHVQLTPPISAGRLLHPRHHSPCYPYARSTRYLSQPNLDLVQRPHKLQDHHLHKRLPKRDRQNLRQLQSRHDPKHHGRRLCCTILVRRW